LALSKKFLELGHHVIICGRNQNTMNESLKEVNNKNFSGTTCDVSKPNEVKNFIEFCLQKFKTIDIWV
jgi:short-subunit dehydrogenase involved in D-alanine esterification of teichoic acids